MSRFSALLMTVLLGLACLPAWATSSANGMSDDFTDYANTQALNKTWKIARFPPGPKDQMATLDASADTVTLRASRGGASEEPGFGLVTMSWHQAVAAIGPGREASVAATFNQYPFVNWAKKSPLNVGVGFSGSRNQPNILAQISRTTKDSRAGTLTYQIDVQDSDGKRVIAQGQVERFGNINGQAMVLLVGPEKITLTIGDKPVIEGGVSHGIDWATSNLDDAPLHPFVRATKTYGKKAVTVQVEQVEVKQQGEVPMAVGRNELEAQLASAPWQAEALLVPPASLVAQLGEARETYPDMVGYNGNLTSVSQFWDREPLADAMALLSPGNLRYPAGSIGNYWDWDTGWLDRNADRTRMMHWVQNLVDDDRTYTLENFAKGQKRLGFTPVYMLNMVTKDLDDQLRQLKRAEAMGMPVTYVELGNEFYFGIGAEPLVHVKYPTPKAYALACNVWAAAIKQEFPDAIVAVIGSEGGPPSVSERRRNWNEQVMPHLSAEIDAVTLHPYAGVGMLNQGKRPWGSKKLQQAQAELLTKPEAIQHMMIEPARSWAFSRRQSPVPDHYDLWLTEFNVNDGMGGVRHTWGQGLALASQLSVFLDDDRVKMLCLHNAFGGVLFNALHGQRPNTFDGLTAVETKPEIEPLTPTATGLIMSMFGQAANGRDTLAPISFGSDVARRFKGTDEPLPLVRGWVFSDSGSTVGSGALVMNLTATPTEADMSSLGLAGHRFTQVSCAPNTYVGSPRQLEQSEGTLGRTLPLPPYSITLLQP
ncbi:MAG: hypothetical protein AAF797_01345 [Planctomycetota bacterium]